MVENYAKWKVWLVCNASLLSLLRQTKGFFCFSFNKRSQKHAVAKTWVFCIRYSRKRSVKQQKKKNNNKKKKKKKKKNAGQCISSNLTATSKNSGTFENKQEKVDFPLSIVFDQALQLKEMVIILMNVNGNMVHLFLSFGHNINIIVHLSISSTSLGFSSFKSNPLKPKLVKWALKSNTYVCKWF